MTAKKRKSSRGSIKTRTARDSDAAPEWTEEQLARAELAIGGKVVRRAKGTLTRPRGRPRVPSPKAVLSLRVDPETLRRLKSSGPDWRKRAAAAIERAAKEL